MRNGKIAEVDAQLPPDNAVVINCGGMLLMPGGHCVQLSAQVLGLGLACDAV